MPKGIYERRRKGPKKVMVRRKLSKKQAAKALSRSIIPTHPNANGDDGPNYNTMEDPRIISQDEHDRAMRQIETELRREQVLSGELRRIVTFLQETLTTVNHLVGPME